MEVSPFTVGGKTYGTGVKRGVNKSRKELREAADKLNTALGMPNPGMQLFGPRFGPFMW